MKNKYLSFFIVLGLAVLLGCSDTTMRQDEQPNILLIFTDDQTYSTIRALGNDEIFTPNIDRLVKEGTTFNQTFNMGGWNGAICTASRSMMISGRSLWRVNEHRKNWQNGDSLELTWGKLMEQQGYDTYMTGKWHVDASAEEVFQLARHIRPGMPGDSWDHFDMVDKFNNEVATGTVTADEIMPVGYNRPLSPEDTSWSPTDPRFGGYWEGGKHWSEVVRDDALEFLDSAKHSTNPFFMYIAFNAPHDPRQAPQEYLDLYNADQLSLPASWQPELPGQELMGNGPSLRDEALAPFPRTEFATKTHIKEYYAIISHMDAQIGEILNALESSGKANNTYVFFTSDHGLAMGSHGLIGKQSMYDHSIRPPLIMKGPNIPKNRQVDQEVYLQDIMPTSLELAGIKRPGYMEFNSLLPLALGKQTKGAYDAIYGAYIDWQRMVRKDGFKLIVYPKAEKVLLFDLENDPYEINDLSEAPEYEHKLKELSNELLRLQIKYADPLDIRDLLKPFLSGQAV